MRTPTMKLANLLAIAASIASLIVVLHSAYFTWKYYSVTPFWDFWNWISDYQTYIGGHYTLHDLIKPHNEHRILTARLVLFVDAIFFHMTGRFVVALNFALLVALGVIFGMMWRAPRASAETATLTACILAAWMTSTCQWFNLLLPFQVQWVLLSLSLVAAAILVVKSTSVGQSGRSAAAWAILAGLGYGAAAFSVAGGLVEFPWLILLLLLRRARALPATLFTGTAGAAVFLFLHDYHPVGGISVTLSTQPLVVAALLQFAAGVLGSAFYAFGRFAFVAGFVGLALFALTGAGIMHAVLLRRQQLPGRMLALFAVAGTVATMACAAAVSRLSTGMDIALAPRYAILSLIFWASMLPLIPQYLFRVWPSQTARRIGLLPVPLGLLAAAILACNFSASYNADARNTAGTLASQGVAMRQNVFVPDLFSFMIFDGVAKWASQLSFLHGYELAVFAPGAGALPPSISPPATAAAINSLPSCIGGFDRAYRLDATRFVLRGWAASADTRRAADWIAFLAPDNRLVAAVPATDYRSDLRHPLHTHTPPRGIRAGISDKLSGAESDVTLRAVGLFANDPARTCVLPHTVNFSPLRVQNLPNAAEVHPAASGEPPALQGAFIENGVSAALRLGTAWPQNIMFSTSSAGDQATGQVAFTLTPGSRDDVVIPYATGPDPSGQQLSVLFADGTRYAQVIPAGWEATKWHAITVPHSAIARHGGGKIIVIAQDNGTGWGQWIAVGTPMLTTLDPAWARLY
jgi:hypothetical protein